MKVSVGLLVLCVALCQAVPGWEEGKEYVYRYEGKYGTGVADREVTQLSGRGISGKLHVYYKNNEIALKFTDLKGAEYNRRLNNAFDPLHLDYAVPEGVPDHITSDFVTPFYGDYHNDGRITELRHTGSRVPEALNWKRAMLSLFQVYLPTDGPKLHFYGVNETNIGGDCEVSYSITHTPTDDHPNEEVLNITKTHWYDRCTYRPHQFFSSASGYKCEHCHEDDSRPFKALGEVQYHIKGNREHYTIQHIMSNGAIMFTPFTSNGQTVMSITNQTLWLEQVADAEYPAHTGEVKTEPGLHYILVSERLDLDHVDLKKNHHYRTLYYKNLENRVEKAEAFLDTLTPSFAGYSTIANNIVKLGYIMHSFDYEDYVKFFEKNVHLEESATPVEKDRRNVILKALPLIGTSPSIHYAIELIKTEKLPVKIAIEMIAVLPFYAKTPSLALLEDFASLAKSDLVNSNTEHVGFAATWLAYGTLVYKSCVKDDFNPHPALHKTYVTHDQCKPYIQELINRLHQAKTDTEKCVYVRALKNTQTDEAFEILVNEVIPAGKYNTYIRATAIWGLEHYVECHQEQVLAAVVPILIDQHESYMLRIYAFDILIYAEPSPVVFGSLVLHINQEPNEKLTSYIYSTLSQAANTTDPCYEKIRKQARLFLPYIVNRGWDAVRHSTNRIYSVYNEKFGFGRTSQFVYIPSNDTLFPRELYMRQSVNWAGYNFDALEIGFIQKGKHSLDIALAALMEKYGLINPVKQSKDDYDMAKHYNIEEILSHGSKEFYGRLFNQDVIVNHGDLFPVQNPYITKIDDAHIEIHYSKVISALQMEFLVPNELGLPVVLRLHAPMVAKVEGKVGVKKAEKTIDLDLYYGADLEINGAMEVISPLFGEYGFRLRTDAGIKFPIKGSVAYDAEHHAVTLREKVPEEAYDFLHYDTVPLTFDNEHEKQIHYADTPSVRQYKFGHKYFGAGYRVDVSSDSEFKPYKKIIRSLHYEDYYNIADKYYAATRGFLDYALLNPTARPYHINVKYERATTNPATEYVYEFKRTETPYYDEEKSDGDQLIHRKKIEFDLTAEGPKKRSWHLDIEVDRHFPLRDYRHLNVHYTRSEIPDYSDKKFEVCLETKANIHGLKTIYTNPLTAHLPAKVDYEAVLKAGPDCNTDAKQITVKGVATPSENHKNYDLDKLPIYQKCKEDAAKGYEFSYACWKVMKDQGRLGHYEFDITYSDNLNPKVKDTLYRIYQWARHTFYDNLEINRTPEVAIPENQLKVVVNSSYKYPVIDINVYRPHETVHYRNIYVPKYLPRYEPVTISEPLWDRYLRRVFNYHQPMCFLSGDNVLTLDGVLSKYDLGPCYPIAVSDSVTENLVLMFKKIKDGSYTKAMKLVVLNHVLEIQPEGGSLVAILDGNKILTDKQAHIFKNEAGDTRGAIYKNINGYEVDVKFYGLYVYFDGRNAGIKLSNLFRSRQEGMCGNFDGERHHEFRNIDGTLHHDGSEFAHSYAIHEGGCHA